MESRVARLEVLVGKGQRVVVVRGGRLDSSVDQTIMVGPLVPFADDADVLGTGDGVDGAISLVVFFVFFLDWEVLESASSPLAGHLPWRLSRPGRRRTKPGQGKRR